MDFSSLNTFDIIIFAIVIISTLFAFMKGFVRTVLSFITWVGSAIAAFYLAPMVKPLLSHYFTNTMVVDISSVLAVYIVSIIIFSLISLPIVGAVRQLSLGAVDKTLGFAFGLLRGGVFACIIFLSIVLTHALVDTAPAEDKENAGVLFEKNKGQDEASKKQASTKAANILKEDTDKRLGPVWVQEAQTYAILKMGTRMLLDILPADTFDGIRSSIDKIRDNTEKAMLNNGTTQNELITESDMPGTEPTAETGYKPEQQKEIDRVIEQVQPK